MDSETVTGIRSKQAARMVLAKEAEMVKSLVEEGLLTPKHAEEFLEEISYDTGKIEKDRNKLYKYICSFKSPSIVTDRLSTIRQQARRRAEIRRGIKIEKADDRGERDSIYSIEPASPSSPSGKELKVPLLEEE